MSDEEDILLDNEATSTEREIKLTPAPHIKPQNVNPEICVRTSVQTLSWIRLIVTVLAGVTFGYDMVIAAKYAHSRIEGCPYQVFFISCWLLGGISSTTSAGFMIDMIGRRFTIIFSSIFSMGGTLIAGLNSWDPVMSSGRLFTGFGSTLSATAHCVYAAETTDAAFRGYRISLHQLGTAAGALLAILAQSTFNGWENEWRIVICLNLIPIFLVCLLTVLFLPRSPHFLLVRKRTRSRLFWRKMTRHSMTPLFESFMTVICLILFQQICGRYVVLSYASNLFVRLGITIADAAYSASLTLGIVRLICTGLSLCIIDRLGRRPCLIMSTAIMMISIALLSFISYINDTSSSTVNSFVDPHYCASTIISDSSGVLVSSTVLELKPSVSVQEEPRPAGSPPPYPLLPTPLSLVASDGTDAGRMNIGSMTDVLAVVALLVFEAAHALGPATVIRVLLCEMFPATVRGRGAHCATSIYWFSDFLSMVWFVYMNDTFTFEASFLVSSLICLCSIVFTFLFVPETKGKTLNQIGREIRNKSAKTRMYANLYTLPWLNKSEWLRQKSVENRQNNNRPAVQSTVI